MIDFPAVTDLKALVDGIAGAPSEFWHAAELPRVVRPPSEPVGAPQTAWQQTGEELLRFRALGDDWDGAGALAPAAETLDLAQRLIRMLQADVRLPAPARATATPAGTVVLEWQGPGGYLEIEVVGSSRLEWMLVDSQGQAQHGAFGSE